KDYRITYSIGGSSGRSRLNSVTECDGAGNCLPAINFGYTAGGGGIPSAAAPANLGNLTNSQNIAQLLPGDFNGDGVQDLLIIDTAGWSRICYGPNFNLSQCAQPWYLGPHKAIVLDYNGDGISDVAI